MGQAVKKIIQRASRYTLSEEDERTLFFAKEKDNQRVVPTELKDISQTGVGLVVPIQEAPEKGELLKVEFTVPKQGKIAWWAFVVRVSPIEVKKWWMKVEEGEDTSPREAFVALHFQEMPAGHKKVILSGLEARFRELRQKQREKRKEEILLFLKENKWKLMGFFLLTFLSVAILYLLAQPSENYDAKRGSPWGQRFDFFRIKK